MKSWVVSGLPANITAYTIGLALESLLPLVTFPYLVAALGMESYGIYVFTQYVLSYILLLTDGSFSVVGPAEVAQRSAGDGTLHQYILNVQMARLVLLGMVLTVWCVIIVHLSPGSDNTWLWMWTMVACVGRSLSPEFVWVGLQRGTVKVAWAIASRLTFLVLIVTFVHYPTDVLWTVASQGIASMVPVFGFIGLRKQYVLSRRTPLDFMDGLRMLYVHKRTIATTLIISANSNANGVLLGLFYPKEAVGLYAAIEKIVLAAYGVFGALSAAVGPMVARIAGKAPQIALALIRKVFVCSIALSISLYACVNVFPAEILAMLLGSVTSTSLLLLRLMSLNILVAPISMLAGGIYLLPFSRMRTWSIVFISYGSIGVMISVFMVGLLHLGLWGATWAYVATQIAMAVTCLLIVVRAYISVKHNDTLVQHGGRRM